MILKKSWTHVDIINLYIYIYTYIYIQFMLKVTNDCVFEWSVSDGARWIWMFKLLVPSCITRNLLIIYNVLQPPILVCFFGIVV
jgi:hypothetical protein